MYVFATQPGSVAEIKINMRAQTYGMVSGVMTSSTRTKWSCLSV